MIAPVAVLLLAAALLQAEGGEPALQFRTSAGGGYQFETGVLRGVLRAGGKSEGLSNVVHVPSGREISGTHGLVGHYRLLAANQRFMPDGWTTPSDATLEKDGAVQVHWAPVKDRPFEMWATYRWAGPAALDVETKVKANAPLKAFESFLASYFAEGFSRSGAWVQTGKGAFAGTDPESGPWQMFPRDTGAIRLIQDGRWTFPPNPVDWRIRANLALPIGIRRDSQSGLVAVVMALSEDCFAVSSPADGDNHRSIYLSLFGRHLAEGESLNARARLVIGSFTDDEITKRYREFRESANLRSGK